LLFAHAVVAGWYGMSISINSLTKLQKTFTKEHAIEPVLRSAAGLGEADFCIEGDVLVHPLVREERNRRQTLRACHAGLFNAAERAALRQPCCIQGAK